MHLRDEDERLSFTVEAVERFVETAAARGIDEIGFTEDFLLGSVHWLGEQAVDAGEGLSDAAPYFAALAAAAENGHFDVLSHLDLVKIFGLRPDPELHDGIVDAIAASGVAVEVSTAGLRKPVGEIYPGPELLARLRECGVPITLASDAHLPSLVGEDFGLALEAAREAGYGTVTVIESRPAYQEPLG